MLMRFLFLFLMLFQAACNTDIYTRDGVTDGDTFYVAPVAMASSDPALQSWVTYSLVKSTCQLETGGDNPGRVSNYDCEFRARRNLVEAWAEKRISDQSLMDPYLDELTAVSAAGFLAEYTVQYFGRADWALPDGLRPAEFRAWQQQNLPRHKPETRLVGYWGHSEF